MSAGELRATVQTYAEGLLSFLGVKNAGQNPHELAKIIDPVIDIAPWMFATRAVNSLIATGTTVAGIGFVPINATNALIVPNGELWYVIDYRVTATLIAGEDINFSAAYADLNNTGFYPIGPGAGGAGISRPSARAERPFFLPSGYRLGAWLAFQTTAATIEMDAQARYVRFST